MRAARFAMVDDATALRASIADLLPAMRFTSVHRSVEELLGERPDADVVILDLHLANALQPGASQGIAAVSQVIEAGYRVCVYTQEERRFVLAACLAAGALGVVSKASSLEDAASSFLAVAEGDLVMPPAVTGLIEVLARRGALTILTPRQRDVLAGRARGLTYAELSRSLFLSESTLRGYWRDLTDMVSQYLQATSPGDIERALGLGPGDLIDCWPDKPAA
jgi:DNA-binding NarL/FixJ family response regulator